MDPITGAIVAIVLWLVSISIVWVAVYFTGVIIGAATSNSEGGVLLGAVIGWLVGGGWAIFALIQAITQIVHLIQLIWP